MRTVSLVLVLALGSTSCASVHGKKRALYGGAMGASVGAFGGYALSPNTESRGLNALVFGLTGALIGGVTALLTDEVPEAKESHVDLEARERHGKPGTEYQSSPNQNLPEFLKSRLKPAIIEEYIERDQVTEDGALREPHKVYRIKQPAELIASPNTQPIEVKK